MSYNEALAAFEAANKEELRKISRKEVFVVFERKAEGFVFRVENILPDIDEASAFIELPPAGRSRISFVFDVLTLLQAGSISLEDIRIYGRAVLSRAKPFFAGKVRDTNRQTPRPQVARFARFGKEWKVRSGDEALLGEHLPQIFEGSDEEFVAFVDTTPDVLALYRQALEAKMLRRRSFYPEGMIGGLFGKYSSALLDYDPAEAAPAS